MNYIEKYNRLKKEAWAGEWGVRILSELQYLIELSRVSEDRYRALLEEAVEKLYAYVEENGKGDCLFPGGGFKGHGGRRKGPKGASHCPRSH